MQPKAGGRNSEGDGEERACQGDEVAALKECGQYENVSGSTFTRGKGIK